MATKEPKGTELWRDEATRAELLKYIDELEAQAINMDKAMDERGQTSGPLIGQAYLVRTVTHYYTGLVSAKSAKWLHLADAAWIPDTGRFSDCVAKAKCGEVEPYPSGTLINLDSTVDISPWNNPLPRTQK